MDFPEIALILIVALIFLGPEKMIELATRLGELIRKLRETWDELRYQMYMEEINRKVMKEQESMAVDDIEQEQQKEVKENGKASTSQDAADGTSEGTQKQAD
ncbi:MAG: twin-arginine translocase TatA/TatE family subunit [Aquificaceae bacterium]